MKKEKLKDTQLDEREKEKWTRGKKVGNERKKNCEEERNKGQGKRRGGMDEEEGRWERD